MNIASIATILAIIYYLTGFNTCGHYRRVNGREGFNGFDGRGLDDFGGQESRETPIIFYGPNGYESDHANYRGRYRCLCEVRECFGEREGPEGRRGGRGGEREGPGSRRGGRGGEREGPGSRRGGRGQRQALSVAYDFGIGSGKSGNRGGIGGRDIGIGGGRC